MFHRQVCNYVLEIDFNRTVLFMHWVDVIHVGFCIKFMKSPHGSCFVGWDGEWGQRWSWGGGLAFIIKAPMWIGRHIHKHSRTKRVSVMELNINGFLLSQNPTNEESWCAKKKNVFVIYSASAELQRARKRCRVVLKACSGHAHPSANLRHCCRICSPTVRWTGASISRERCTTDACWETEVLHRMAVWSRVMTLFLLQNILCKLWNTCLATSL